MMATIVDIMNVAHTLTVRLCHTITQRTLVRGAIMRSPPMYEPAMRRTLKQSSLMRCPLIRHRAMQQPIVRQPWVPVHDHRPVQRATQRGRHGRFHDTHVVGVVHGAIRGPEICANMDMCIVRAAVMVLAVRGSVPAASIAGGREGCTVTIGTIVVSDGVP